MCSPCKVPAVALLARQASGRGQGAVSVAPWSWPSMLLHFHLLPSSVSAPGTDDLTQQIDLMLPDYPHSFLFRFYTFITYTSNPVSTALPLSIILHFLPLHRLSQLLFSSLRQGDTAGLIRAGLLQAWERGGRHTAGAAARGDILQVFPVSRKHHSSAAGGVGVQRAMSVAGFARTG